MARIIQICGINGSGKSYVAREFLKGMKLEPEFIDGYPNPIGYWDRSGELFLMGAYIVGTGGCDSIKHLDLKQQFAYIEEKHSEGKWVVFEGIMMANHTRGVALWKQTRALTVLRLTTPFDVCVKSIQERRAKVGKSRVMEARTMYHLNNQRVRVENYCYKLRMAGCKVLPVSRENALETLYQQIAGED